MNSKCQECRARAESMGVVPNGTDGNFLYPLCDGHAVTFRTQGPRALPTVWRDAVVTLAARIQPAWSPEQVHQILVAMGEEAP
jgi:hypothetical protein